MINGTVKKIAILNPYLQGGHTETAEIEAGIRFTNAAKKMGIETKIFAKSEELYHFNPDFVITHAYQDAKLTSFPTYGLLTMPVAWVKDSVRFVRNILTYDGFLGVSENVHNWVQALCVATNKPFFFAHAAFSIPETKFEPLNYAKATAVYLGTNWDGTRHNNLFSFLGDGQHIKCFGPPKSWQNIPAALYGGPVPFDGQAVLDTYRKHAAGLCINHKDFDADGAPTSRMYEIFAAGAIAIASKNAYVQTRLGDSVLYVDHQAAPEILAKQIKAHVEWIRQNPDAAEAKAEKAHQIFVQELSMEFFLNNILELHQKYLASTQEHKLAQIQVPPVEATRTEPSWLRKFFKKISASPRRQGSVTKNFSIILVTNETDQLSQIETYIDQLLPYLNPFNQIDILLGQAAHAPSLLEKYKNIPSLAIRLMDKSQSIEEILCQCVQDSPVYFTAIVTLEQRIFLEQANAFFANSAVSDEEILVFGSIEAAKNRCLPELLRDGNCIIRNEKLRIGYFPIVKEGQFKQSKDLSTSHIYFIRSDVLPQLLAGKKAQKAINLLFNINSAGRGRNKIFYPWIMGEILLAD